MKILSNKLFDLFATKKFKKNLKVNNSKISQVFSYVLRYIILIAFAYVLLYPILFIIANSLKGPADYFNPTVVWLTNVISIENYKTAFGILDFWEGLKNTIVYMVVAAVLEIISCSFAAYGLARFNFKGKRILSFVMLLTFLVPSVMIMLPSYINFRYADIFGILGLIGKLVGNELRINLLDTPFVFWLPSIFAVGIKGGLFIFIYSQFYKGLPKEFEEAAYIDGAGPVKTYFSIIIPSSVVPTVTVSLFAVVWHWNEYYLSSLYLSENRPLAVKLYSFVDNINSYFSGAASSTILTGPSVMAGCVVFIVPMIIFYIIMQRKFISSIVNSGIVG